MLVLELEGVDDKLANFPPGRLAAVGAILVMNQYVRCSKTTNESDIRLIIYP